MTKILPRRYGWAGALRGPTDGAVSGRRQVSHTAGDGCSTGASGRRTDFFISHAGRDTGWAEWLAWQLQQAGYRVELDVWDRAPGEDFVARMQTALEDRKSTRLNSSHANISYAVFCLKKKKKNIIT